MHCSSFAYGITSAFILWTYPAINSFCLVLSLAYIAMYLTLSVYRTYNPLPLFDEQVADKFED